MENQEKYEESKRSRYEEMVALIMKSSPTDFKQPTGFVIPLKKSVLVEQVDNKFLRTSAGGIILAEGESNNSATPMVGTLVAVGPEVSEYLIPGQRVVCNQYANLEIQLYGKTYVKMEEHDVYGILPDVAFVSVDKKDADEVRTEKKIEQMKSQQKVVGNREITDKNKKELEKLAKKGGFKFKA